jgi:hypothetical protein
MNETRRQTVITAMQAIMSSKNPGIKLDLSLDKSNANDDEFFFFFFFLFFYCIDDYIDYVPDILDFYD